MKLLITMGYHIQSNDRKDHWLYDTAALVVLDWDARKIVREFTYRSPPSQAAATGHMLFACGHRMQDKLLVTTHTEVVLFDIATWQIVRVLSLPHFNDLHAAVPADDVSIYVCNTGLQAVQRVTWEGDVLETHATGDRETWSVYDIEKDYRPLSTKPHDVHPNFLFWYDGLLWVTRCNRCDAVAVTDHNRVLSVSVGNPHDGVVHGDLIHFTTTNAHLVGIDPASGARKRDIDLNRLDSRNQQLGWCRGLTFIEEHRALIGFGQFRRSKHKELIHWIVNDGKARLPTRLGLYDLREPRLIEEYAFTGEREGACLYSIHRLDDDWE